MMAARKAVLILAFSALSAAVGYSQALQVDTNPNLPDGQLGAPYLSSFAARGGTPPYRWSLVDGALPNGVLFIDLTGSLAGLPIEAGQFQFRVRVTDAVNDTAQRNFTLNIIGPLSVSSTSLPNATVNQPYTVAVTANGGTPPYAFAVSAGTLPSGLTLNANGGISGSTASPGNFDFTVSVTDSASQSATRQLRITVVPVSSPPSITNPSLPGGTLGQAYTASLAATGGSPPYAFTITAGSFPPGLTLGSNGGISGTPTSAGDFDFTATVTDSASQSAARQFRLTIVAAPTPPAITTASLANGTVGQVYTGTLAASGGTPPYTFAVASGAFPAGLTLGSNGTITGTPTAAGGFDFTARVTDSVNQAATRQLRITVTAAPTPPTITTTSFTNGTVGQAYTSAIAASGGTPPYAFAVTTGTLPPGVTLNAAGAISGTPTTAGDFDFTAQVTDSVNQTATRQLRITIVAAPIPPSITTASLANGRVGQAYSVTISATGGTPPYVFAVASGNLPPGLTISANGAVSGGPTTAGDFDFTAQVTDSASQTATRQLRITITTAPVPPSITTTSLANGRVGQAYSGAIAANGGTPPYAFTVASGNFPAGLALAANGSISGTPTTAGDFDFNAQVTDSANQTATRQLRVTVTAAPTPPSITTASLANGTVGQAYSASLAASGGTAPYTFAVATGSLPPGVTLNPNGSISGTPTAAGNFDFTARVTDSASQTATRQLRITITTALTPPAITTSSLANGTVGQAYSGAIAASGGAPPYSFTASAGTFPPGLALNANGSISGTPTTAGNFDFTARVADSASQVATRQLRITITAAPTPPAITTSALANGTVGQTYSGTIAASGGTPPYSFTASAGTFPPGLGLNANGSISGTPTTAGDFDFTARVADSANRSATRQLRITIRSATPPSISTTSLPAGTVNQSYTGSINATGGSPPYTFSAPAGTFAPGLGLNPNGTISGTPTAAGNFDFTARVTDSASQSATRQLRFTISAAPTPVAISNSALPNASVGVAFSQALAATGGRPPYVWTVVSGSLPAGLTLASAGNISGTPTAGGASPVTLRVTDADSRTAERAFTINVTAAVSISACPTATGSVGSAYSAQPAATGGTPPYVWSVTTGQLPPGVLLSPSGQFSGTPILGGSFSFTLNTSDAAGRSGNRACSIAIVGALQILTETLPDASIRETYAQTLRATGGAPPYRWTAISGTAPPGLALDEASGALTGQPALPGRFSFNIQLSDTTGSNTQRAFTINVSSGITIPACPTGSGIVGQAYSSNLTAVGGQPPYTWSVVAGGSLPAGLELAGGGVLAGTPAAPGRSEFSVRVTDNLNASLERPCAIQIAAELSITTATLPAAEVGAAYQANIEAVGGTTPRNWTISAGALAPGLTLNSATGDVTGTATAPGAYRFTVRVADATGAQRERQLEIIVGAGFVISACPAPSALIGQPYSSSVSLSGGEAPLVWSISSGALPVGVSLSAATGVFVGTPTALGNLDFIISVTDARSRSTTRACNINVVPAALRISGPDPFPDANLGSAFTANLQVEGGRAPYVWVMAEGILPPGVALSSSGVISGTPTATGSFPLVVRVTDADGAIATRSITLRVVPASAPNISFTDLPDIVQPAQQPRVRVTLASAYPAPIRGRLTMRFTPDPGLNVDDPAIRFVNGAREVEFDIPADATEAAFPVPQFALQTGSVAGVIDLAITLTAGGLDITPSTSATRAIRIDRTAPVITSVRINRTAGGFEVVVAGYSTTREVTNAAFRFTPAAGSRLESDQLTVQTDASARQWFSDTRSNGFGGQFTFTQPFTLTNATLAEVSVTLTNGQGVSQLSTARF